MAAPVSGGVIGRLVVATGARWQLNFVEPRPVEVLLWGRRRRGVALRVTEPRLAASRWAALVAHRPMLGRLAGIDIGPDRSVSVEQVTAAAERGWTVLEIRLDVVVSAPARWMGGGRRGSR